MRLILLNEFRFLHISFGSMVKFQFLAQLLVDSPFLPVTHYILIIITIISKHVSAFTSVVSDDFSVVSLQDSCKNFSLFYLSG